MGSLYGLVVGTALVLAIWIAERILIENLDPLLTGKKYRAQATRSLQWLPVFLFVLGVVGGRIYHLIVDWSLYVHQPWWSWLAVWNGGLGIFGAMVGGFLGLLVWRALFRPPWSLVQILDVTALALPFGQALGRWGNFFNQELYGRPTRSAWGVPIELENRLPGYENFTHFHALFLYESISMLLVGFGLYGLYRSSRSLSLFRVGQGWFVGLYLLAYGSIRFWLEFLRLDSAPGWYGLPTAQWVSLFCAILGLVWLVRSARKMSAAGLVAVVWLILSARLAQAQQKYPFDLSVSPSVVEIAVKPGTLVTQAFLVENSGSYDLEVTPVLRDFTSDGKSGHPVLEDRSAFPYAKLENSEQELDTPFILPADNSQQLVLGLNIPDDAVERDWYFTLLLQTRALGLGAETTGAEARGSVGAHVLVRVTSTNTPSLRWKVWLEALPRVFDSLQSITFHPLITNESETVAAPEISVVVLDWKQNIVYEKTGLPDRILAGATREIFAAEQRKDDPRSSQAVPFIFDPLFAVGPYVVRVSVSNAAGGPLVLEERVWAFPFSIVLAGTLVAGVGAWLSHSRKKP